VSVSNLVISRTTGQHFKTACFDVAAVQIDRMSNLVDEDFDTYSKSHAADETDCMSDVTDPSSPLQPPDEPQLLTYRLTTAASGVRSHKVHDKVSGMTTMT